MVLVLVATAGIAQQPVVRAIGQALETGNADALGSHFAESVDVSIADKEHIYSRAQAIEVMRRFFKEKKPVGFKVKHVARKEGHNAAFQIGILRTAQGDFRITYLLKPSESGPQIRRLKINRAAPPRP